MQYDAVPAILEPMSVRVPKQSGTAETPVLVGCRRTPSRAILEPDRLSLYPPEEVAEGYIFETLGEKYVLSDGVRTIDIYHIQGLAHCAGMLIDYLPKEKIVVEADLYSPRGAQAPAYAQCQ